MSSTNGLSLPSITTSSNTTTLLGVSDLGDTEVDPAGDEACTGGVAAYSREVFEESDVSGLFVGQPAAAKSSILEVAASRLSRQNQHLSHRKTLHAYRLMMVVRECKP